MHIFDPAADEKENPVNLTPMLDVVFILLIFFVVTASFIREYGVPVNLPSSTGEPSPQLQSITVRVSAPHVFTVNGRVVSRSSLAAYVRALFAENPGADYVVMVEAEAKVGATVAAVDAGRKLGFDVIPLTRAH